MRSCTSSFLAVALVVSFGACSGGTVTDGATGPTTPTDTTKPPTTVQRASLTVRVTIDPTDAVLANTAGVTVAGVTVRLTRTTPGVAPQTAQTGADGSVKFDGLLDGIYEVGVERALSAAELARLSGGDRESAVFAGSGAVVVSPPSNASASVSLVANKRGSVIISEIFPLNSTSNAALYGEGNYLEVYNNADTTVYLDGMLLGRTPPTLSQDYTAYGSPRCDQVNQNIRLDSTAVYLIWMSQFPGSGRDYPIHPGEAQVIATDAIDHRIAAPGTGQVDLSHAQFEHIGTSADPDNPFSANMILLNGGTGYFGHGFTYGNVPTAHVLARADAKLAMTAVQYVNTNPNANLRLEDATRIPREFVLDVFSAQFDPSSEPTALDPLCSPWMSPVFDTGPAFLVRTRQSIAIARKSLGFTADGREILQRTRSSARDLQWATPLQRSLNKP